MKRKCVAGDVSTYWLTAVLLLNILTPVLAQEKPGPAVKTIGVPILDTLLQTKPPRVDPAYVATYYGRLHIYLLSDRQDYALRVVGPQQPLIYKPNLAWNLGVGINYQWFGADLTLKLPFLGHSVDSKGNTKSFGLTINISNRKLWLTSQYQSYRGYYLRNPEVLQTDWFDHYTAYPIRPDLRSQALSFRLLNTFNTLQFSNPATLFQRERQKKSAGSWVMGAFLNYVHLKGDSSWVPAVLQRDYPTQNRLLAYTAVSGGLDGGYVRTIVFRRYFFTSIGLRPGLAILSEFTRTTPDDQVRSQLRVGWQGTGSLTVGYSNDRYYAGVYASVTMMSRGFAGNVVQTNSDYVRLMVGKRLRYRPKGVIKQIPGF